MSPLDLVTLTPLMKLTNGNPEIKIGLIDGPVVVNHPELASAKIYEISGSENSGSKTLIRSASCAQANSAACKHGTFVAGILCGQRNSVAPAICPNCTLLVRPVFTETNHITAATPEDLSVAILECLAAGVQILNLSVALEKLSITEEIQLKEALDQTARRGVITIAAAGNQGLVGSSAITRHPWVIPVVACDLQNQPTQYSNLGTSAGRRGLTAPGQGITSLSPTGSANFSGTSAAAPFVTGAIALLWSEFPKASAFAIRSAITQAYAPRRTSIVPPLLNAWETYQFMAKNLTRLCDLLTPQSRR